MKFIKVGDTNNEVVSYLETDMESPIQEGFQFIEVSEFPDKEYHWEYLKGKLVQGLKKSNEVVTDFGGHKVIIN